MCKVNASQLFPGVPERFSRCQPCPQVIDYAGNSFVLDQEVPELNPSRSTIPHVRLALRPCRGSVSPRADTGTLGCHELLAATPQRLRTSQLPDGQLEVTRFIRQAARWRRFFRCRLAASNFRSRSA